MSLAAGTRLGAYEIVHPIGKGGMGEVYRARDTKLKRDVAIKVLPDAFAKDDDRMKRFEREARAVAALDHPNIVTIHSVEEESGRHFFTMQLVEGKALSELTPGKGLPLDEFFELAIPMADAVAAAHERGITHRDLKPGNVMVTPEGRVKLLDFGLAKLTELTEPESAEGTTKLRSTHLTEEGEIVGTVAYMSPEQAEGKWVDHRTDVFSLGIMLFELATGELPFQGDTKVAVIASIVKDEPTPARELNPCIPYLLDHIIRRSLKKDPDRRFQSAKDLRNELIELKEEIAAGAVQIGRAPARRVPQRAKAVVLFAAIAVVSFLAGLLIAPRPSPAPQQASIALPNHAPIALGRGEPIGFDMRLFDISKDGERLVYVADLGDTTQLYYHEIGKEGATPLSGTEGAVLPFFSPRGDWVGYAVGRRLMRISLAGGNPEPICEASAGVVWDAEWADDDSIYFVDVAGGRVNRVSPTGANMSAVVTGQPWEYDTLWPISTLPDGRGLLATAAALWPSSGDYSDIVVWDEVSSALKMVLDRAGYDARFVRTRERDYVVYARGGSLWAAEFDIDALVAGEPRLVRSDVRVDGAFLRAQFTLADDGTIVYVEGGDISIGVPTWLDFRDDGQANEDPLAVPPRRYSSFALSEDPEPYLALHVAAERDTIEIYDLARGDLRRALTGENSGWPIFAGDDLVFSALRDEGNGLYRMPLDEGHGPELLRNSDRRIVPYSTFGERIAYTEHSPARNALLSLESEILLPSDGNDWGHQFSPDGRWVTYTTGRDGPWEVYIRSVEELHRVHKVSRGGGMEPIWAHDGSKIVYRNGSLWLEVEVQTEPEFRKSEPRELGRTPFIDNYGLSWRLGADGRILVVKPTVEASDPTELQFIQNWFQEFERLVP